MIINGAKAFAIALAGVMPEWLFNHSVAKAYPKYLSTHGKEGRLPRTELQSNYSIDAKTEIHRYEFRAVTAGYAHLWIVEFGKILDETLNAPYVQSSFGELSKADAAVKDSGSDIKFTLISYEFKDYRAYVSMNVMLSDNGKEVLNKSYTSEGESKRGKILVLGSLGMKNVVLDSTKKAIDKILTQFINDIPVAAHHGMKTSLLVDKNVNSGEVKKKDFASNLKKYAEFTKKRNWEEICRLNNLELDSLGTKKELNVLANYLEDDEIVFALTSGIMGQTETSNSFDFGANTWLVALTSERFLFLDCAMLTNSVDTQSIRHDKVQAVSASQGLILGKVIVDLGSRVLVIDNCQKATVSVVADLANKWQKELQKQKSTTVSNSNASAEESPLDKLEKLAKLFATGALTDEEFKAAKAKILAAM